MAKIHLVKDGVTRKGESLTSSYDVPIEDARRELGHRNTRYSQGVPRINPDTEVNDFAEYRHVVLEIEDGEQGEAFSEPGYYVVLGLSPRDCLALFDRRGPLV